jgi:putative addiction module killer protein
MNYEIHTTEVFDKWTAKLKDRQAAMAIALRLARVASGNFGDTKVIGDGVSELRIFVGPGYRIYYTIRNNEIVILLCGGDKSSQQNDIKQAKELAKNL